MGSSKKKSSKKKNSSSSLSKSPTPNQKQQHNEESSSFSSSQPNYFHKERGYMTLTVRQSNHVKHKSSTSISSNTMSMKHDPHIVLLHPSDAKLLKVGHGDQVFFLCHHGSLPTTNSHTNNNMNKIGTNFWKDELFGGVCTVNLYNPKKASTKKRSVREGEAFLSTTLLQDAYHDFQTKYQQTHTSSIMDPPTPTNHHSSSTPTNSTPTIFQTPSPSKSKFSFSRGGGGDLIISPSPSKTPTNTNPISPLVKRNAITQTMMVMPFHHRYSTTFAHSLAKQIIHPMASHVLLEPVICSDAAVSTYKNHLQIFETLALASLQSSYLQKGNYVTIPYQGNKHIYKVLDITNLQIQERSKMFMVQNSFSQLTLHPKEVKETVESKEDVVINDISNGRTANDPNPSSMEDFMTRFVDNLRHSDQYWEPLLYKITYDTKISFHIPDASTSVSGDNVLLSSSTETTSSFNPNIKVGGLSQVLKALEEALEHPLFQPWLYSSHTSSSSTSSLRPPRGVLLFGPSGVGKSSILHPLQFNLTQKAKMLQIPFQIQVVSCHSLISSSAVGENESKLSELFRSKNDVSISNSRFLHSQNSYITKLIILDDIHLLCPRRGGLHTSASTDQMASTLLSLLDGIDTSSKNNVHFVVLGITRQPSDLDPALRRPGRLDVEIEIPIPDDKARSDIWEVQLHQYVSNVTIENSMTTDDSDEYKYHEEGEIYTQLAKRAKGFSGADTLLAIKEALRMSYLDSNDSDAQRNSKSFLSYLYQSIPTILPSTLRTSQQALVEIPKVYWTDIGGMEEPKRLLQEAISLPLTHPHLFAHFSIPPPRGVLLYGPPGCSKTLMARALATEGQMNFLAVKGPELLSKWLGESERALAGLFRRARLASPCVLFFDEMDAIAGKRGGSGGGSGGERILSQLLTELDGVQHTSGSSLSSDSKDDKVLTQRVVVVGATNRPDLLDGALMRPGRMDRKIYVGVPDVKSREKILMIGLKNGKRCDTDVNIENLALDSVTGGFSGAEIVAICREAALFAIEEDEERIESGISENKSQLKPLIGMRHLLKSIHGMKRQITPGMLNFYDRFRKGIL